MKIAEFLVSDWGNSLKIVNDIFSGLRLLSVDFSTEFSDGYHKREIFEIKLLVFENNGPMGILLIKWCFVDSH